MSAVCSLCYIILRGYIDLCLERQGFMLLWTVFEKVLELGTSFISRGVTNINGDSACVL